MHNSYQLLITTALLGFFQLSIAQNCAIPQIVSLPLESNVKTECALPGTILANLTSHHIEKVNNVSQEPVDFIKVEFNKDTGIILLVVDQPLFFNDTGQKTFIDESWKKNVELVVVFLCDDGHEKIVKFILPIVDKNTQPPIFQLQNYTLSMGPCYNGTHAQGKGKEKACPLNFETSIILFDADRDFVNAETVFYSSSNLISITSSVVSEIEMMMSGNASTNHHTLNVRLYLAEGPNYKIGDLFQFNLTAYNTVPLNSFGHIWSPTTTFITISFDENEEIGNQTMIAPPVFSSGLYYSKVTSIFEAMPGMELILKPEKISSKTSTSSNLGYGNGTMPPDVGEESELIVRYSLDSDILEIDPYTGKLVFTENIIAFTKSTLIPTEIMFEITAVIESYEFLFATVPVLVFLSWENETTTEPSICTTTSPSLCPECPTTCPPTGETCPDQTTPYDGITNETDSTTEITTDYSKPWSTFIPNSTTSDYSSTTPNVTTHEPTTAFSTVKPTSSEPPTTEAIVSTTEASTIVPSTEPPTEIPTTPDDDDDTCCDTCHRIKDFECPSGRYDEEIFFPDPHDCQIYYQCEQSEDAVEPLQFRCLEKEIFCPEKQTCVIPGECICTGFSPQKECVGTNGTTSRLLRKCEPCDNCINGSDERNVCNDAEIPDHLMIEDPKYFDIFHVCQKDVNTPWYEDCLIACPTGLVFCSDPGKCLYPYQCDKRDRIPYKCNSCSAYYQSRGIIFTFEDYDFSINF